MVRNALEGHPRCMCGLAGAVWRDAQGQRRACAAFALLPPGDSGRDEFRPPPRVCPCPLPISERPARGWRSWHSNSAMRRTAGASSLTSRAPSLVPPPPKFALPLRVQAPKEQKSKEAKALAAANSSKGKKKVGTGLAGRRVAAPSLLTANEGLSHPQCRRNGPRAS